SVELRRHGRLGEIPPGLLPRVGAIWRSLGGTGHLLESGEWRRWLERSRNRLRLCGLRTWDAHGRRGRLPRLSRLRRRLEWRWLLAAHGVPGRSERHRTSGVPEQLRSVVGRLAVHVGADRLCAGA